MILRMSFNIDQGACSPMIFCHCAAVSDRTIESLIENGASSLSEISRKCGAGRHCAPCREEIVALLSRARTGYSCSESAIAAD